MKKLLVGCALLLAATQPAMGVPARRDVIKEVTQPDGTTLSVKVVGDEHAHAYVTVDNLPLVCDAQGYYRYATLSSDGKAVASKHIARDIASRSAAERSFVATISKDAVCESLLTGILESSSRSSAPMRANQSTGIGLQDDALFPHEGDVHALVILVQYSDVKFVTPNPADYYQRFLNQEGFSDHNGTGSCRDYFMSSSAGKFRPTFDLYGPVTLPNRRSYYGGNNYMGNDMRPEYMVVDAVKALDAEVDFSKYDLDNDGVVDNIYIIYADKGENSYGPAESVWPHQWDLVSAGVTLYADGKRISHYGCCNEYDQMRPTGIGTFCHEFGHVMGLPDLYSTTYNNAATETPGDWSVMDHGSYNNDGRTPPSYSIYERNSMGWIDPVVIDGAAHIELDNIHDSNTGAIILTSSKNEFFLLENRQQTGWDTYLPGHGMLIWHIDYKSHIWSQNKVNNTSGHQYVDIEEASNIPNNEDAGYMAGYPFPGTSRVTSFTDDTKPSMRTWGGEALGKPITNITEKNGRIAFDVCGGRTVDAPASVRHSDVNPGGFTLTWNPVEYAVSYLVDVYTRDNGGNPVPAGIYDSYEVSGTSCPVTRLAAATTYSYTVRAVNGSNISTPSAEGSVTTGEPRFEYAIPQVNDASEISANAFTASWKPLEEASDYLLSVNVVRQSEGITDFCDFGTGNSLKLPEGWTSSSKQLYTTISKNYYIVAPSIKLTKTGDYICTAEYTDDIRRFSVWIRSASSHFENTVEIEARPAVIGRPANDGDWQLLVSRDNLAIDKEGQYITIENMPAGMRQIRLKFLKYTEGNLAVDDMLVETGTLTEEPLAGYTDKAVGSATSCRVEGLPDDAVTCSYYVVARRSDGSHSLASDPAIVELKGGNSGISNITTPTGATSVTAENGLITVNTTAGATIYVADLAGRIIGSTRADHNGSASIQAPAGIAIVKVNGTAFKVAVR